MDPPSHTGLDTAMSRSVDDVNMCVGNAALGSGRQCIVHNHHQVVLS